MSVKTSKDKIAHIKRLDKKEYPYASIVIETGASYGTVCKYTKPRHAVRPKEDAPLILALWADGMQVKEICKKFECSKSYVYRIIEKKNRTISVFSLIKEIPTEPKTITWNGKVKGTFTPHN